MEKDTIADKLPPHVTRGKVFMRLKIQRWLGLWRVKYEDCTFGENNIICDHTTLSGAIKKMIKELKI